MREGPPASGGKSYSDCVVEKLMAPAQSRAMVETSVVIPSYRRPADLQRTIASVLAQEGVAAAYEILVVDNDPDGSAAPAVAAMIAHGAAPIRYVREPRPGISHARNTGIAHAA